MTPKHQISLKTCRATVTRKCRYGTRCRCGRGRSRYQRTTENTLSSVKGASPTGFIKMNVNFRTPANSTIRHRKLYLCKNLWTSCCPDDLTLIWMPWYNWRATGPDHRCPSVKKNYSFAEKWCEPWNIYMVLYEHELILVKLGTPFPTDNEVVHNYTSCWWTTRDEKSQKLSSRYSSTPLYTFHYMP